MQPIYSFLVLLYYFLSSICNTAEFNLNDYSRTHQTPSSFTLALLDKSMVIKGNEEERIPETIRPFIHVGAKQTSNRSLCVKTFLEDGLYPAHFVVEIKCNKHVLRSALLTNALLAGKKTSSDSAMLIDDNDEESVSSDIESSVYDSEDDDEVSSSSNFDGNEVDQEYAASMVLFPITGEPNKMLVYLLGSWLSLLNTTSIVPLFGLKIATSIGVASTQEDKDNELNSIKEIVTETHRRAKPIRGTGKQQKGLGRIGDFEVDSASDGLEKVRLKPIQHWGKSLLDGDDFLKFRLTTKGNKAFDNSISMYEVAQEAYKHYSESPIHKDFMPYLDEPVVDGNKDHLNTLLNKNWQKYFNTGQILYMHWTFWFHAKGEQDISAILRKIRQNQEVQIGGQDYKATQLVRSLPISFGENFYWFDRGLWYRIQPTRFEAIRKRIDEITVKQEDLFLPDYEIDTSVDEVSTQGEDYKELAYNKSIIEAMKAQMGPGKPMSEAILLDRENAQLGGRGNQFEFADIFVQSSNGKYFLTHVKREGAREFDHHRTQAERCALFLGESLDRSILPGLLITGILQDFYNSNIKLPKEKSKDPKKTKLIERPWSTTFKTKFSEKKKTPLTQPKQKTKKERVSEFTKTICDEILRANKKERKLIKTIVTHSEIKPLIGRFEPYEDALCRCLDALDDLIFYGSQISEDEKKSGKIHPNNIAFVKAFFEGVLVFLEKHPSFTKKHQGIFSFNDRKKITIVQAIIKDVNESEVFNKQRLWGLDQTRKLVEKQGFNFQVVFIKDQTKKKKKRKSDEITASAPTASATSTTNDSELDTQSSSKKMKIQEDDDVSTISYTPSPTFSTLMDTSEAPSSLSTQSETPTFKGPFLSSEVKMENRESSMDFQ